MSSAAADGADEFIKDSESSARLGRKKVRGEETMGERFGVPVFSKYVAPEPEEITARDISLTERIIEACIILNVDSIAMSKALSFWHRCKLYSEEHKSASELRRKYNDDLLCTTVIFLACKCVDDARRLRNVLTTVERVKHPSLDFIPLDRNYHAMKEKIISCEHIVLRILKFRTDYESPHLPLLNFLTWIGLSGDREWCQISFTLANTSLQSRKLCLHVDRNAVAVACIYVGGLFLDRPVSIEFLAAEQPGNVPWWEPLGVSTATVHEACFRLTHLVASILSFGR